MKVSKIVRNGMAGALIAFLPLTASVAATRPSAAVPVAGSTAIAAQSDEDGAFGISWPALAVIVLTLAVAIWILLDDDGDGEGSLSRG
ncbi:hypothetical protein [Sphingomonas sp.]|uniref:hypothetical protein n=1 Tax=Sphingomonas sp. TaxID=28214 RepID=UPI00286D753E|nr:hypothetical protein [Sphingomonas sp.]